MTATTAERPAIPDDEIREWGRATGRTVPERGRVSAKLRAEYEATVTQIGAHVDAGDPPAGGPERSAERPRPAAAERRPVPVPKPSSGWRERARALISGTPPAAGGKKTAAAKAPPKEPRPRTPVTRVVERIWNQAARAYEHVNIPVARTMQWQSPYIGIVVEDVIKATPLDRILQPLARVETAATGVGAMIAMPFIVGAITSERNNPDTHGMAAVVRQQLLHSALDECIDSQLEMFGNAELVGKIAKSAAQQATRTADIDRIRGMIFAAMPPGPDMPENPTAAQMQAAEAEAARAAAAEQSMREAAAAVHFMRPPEPDNRGQAAERAAASMAASAAAAAAGQDQAIAAASRNENPYNLNR